MQISRILLNKFTFELIISNWLTATFILGNILCIAILKCAIFSIHLFFKSIFVITYIIILEEKYFIRAFHRCVT